jgi:hypothetical protein
VRWEGAVRVAGVGEKAPGASAAAKGKGGGGGAGGGGAWRDAFVVLHGARLLCWRSEARPRDRWRVAQRSASLKPRREQLSNARLLCRRSEAARNDCY